jgi:hypothetical protein
MRVGDEHTVEARAAATQMIGDRLQVRRSSLPRIDQHCASSMIRDEERIVAIAGHRTGIVGV